MGTPEDGAREFQREHQALHEKTWPSTVEVRGLPPPTVPALDIVRTTPPKSPLPEEAETKLVGAVMQDYPGGPDADAHRQLVGRKGAGLRRAEPGTPQVCIPRGCPESPADPVIGGKAQDEDPGFDTRRVPEGDDHPHTGEVGQLL